LAAQRKRVKTTAGSRADTSADSGKFKAFLQKIGGRGPWWSQTLRWFGVLSVTGIVGLALLFFILYKTIDIPTANAAFQDQTTNVYYSDGKHKIGSFSKQDRESVPLSDIPTSMQAAVIAAEDRTFYTNRGIDIKGIIRAARSNATSGSIQSGGSTITQQYVKILYLTEQRSYTRKLKEAILSIKIHNQKTKKQILEGYLNTIYFGNRAYGVEVAAKTYFDKSASDLNYAQSALLATIVNSPTYYDPYADGAAARIQPRLNYVLDGMVKSGAITAAQAAKFQDRVPNVVKKRVVNTFSGSKGYLLQLVLEKMEDKNGLNFSDQIVSGGGLKIVTTFDYKKQKAAVAAIKAYRPAGHKELNQALVSIKPGNGAVEAMYGGRDYLKASRNWAADFKTQPGSTFKAFAVVAALENGYSLKTKLNGASPLYIDGKYITKNEGDSGGETFGNVSLAKATAESINTAFVDLMHQMKDGPAKTLDAAVAAGIPEKADIDPVRTQPGGPPLVTPLGYFPVAPVDMANAYATLAAGGKRAEWYVIQKVTQKDKTLYAHKVSTKRTIPADVAADTVAAMQGVVRSGTGVSARTICPTAGKTGTATAGTTATNQHVSSSWFAGFSPKLVTAVMYNRGDNGNGNLEGYLLPTFFGGNIPAHTFQAYMNSALAGTDCGTFPPAANIKSTKGTTYKPPPPKCDSDEILNDAKTKCIQKPPPTCKSDEMLNPTKTACIPKPVTCIPPQVLDPTTNTCVDPSTTNPPTNKDDCEAAGGTWYSIPSPGRCVGLPASGTGGWIFLVPFAGLVGLRRPEDGERTDARERRRPSRG
jgi:membrane peptidoglycan carboxypeptidase